jgi:tRNA(Ile2) C34 agmatinyltransferase TiaS
MLEKVKQSAINVNIFCIMGLMMMKFMKCKKCGSEDIDIYINGYRCNMCGYIEYKASFPNG